MSSQLPRIVILTTGGTIVSSASSRTQLTGYSIQDVTVDDLLASVPEMANIATTRVERVSNIDSGSMISAIWFRLARRLEELAADDQVDGCVITHGTDTMEETAFFLHLTVHTDKPIVITGAMRPASAISADGPLNLYNAVLLAGSPEAAGKGVLLTLNDRVFSARQVTKIHPENADAFGHPDFGAVGLIAGGRVTLLQRPLRPHTARSELRLPESGVLPRVDIIVSHVDQDGVLIRAAVEAGARGIVYAGTGNGTVHDAAEPWLCQAAERGVVIVRATRIGAGAVTEGLERWQRAGFIPAGALSAAQARILLQLALTVSSDPARVAEFFERY